MLALAAEAAARGETLDERRWRSLVQQHAPFLRRSLARLAGVGPHVDDLVQESFVTAYRRRADLPADAEMMRAWLYRTAKNHWLHHQRETGRRLTRHEAAAAEPVAPPRSVEDRLNAAAEAALLRAALADLDLPMREAIVLVDLEGLKASEAAVLLKLGEDTLRSRLRRGRESLRRLLNERLATNGGAR